MLVFEYRVTFRPGGIPARSEKGERLLLFIGIIDILQSYRLKKKLEHTFKSIIHDGVIIISISPISTIELLAMALVAELHLVLGAISDTDTAVNA